MKTAILLAALALAGCADMQTTFLKNEAGQEVRCAGSHWAPWRWDTYASGVDAHRCVSEYEARGYRVEDGVVAARPIVDQKQGFESSPPPKPTANLAVCASLSTPEVRQKCVDKVSEK